MPVAGAVSLIELGIGEANKAQSKAEAATLSASRPKVGLNSDELNLAESELQQGVSARAERAYEMQSNKGLSGSLSALLKGGGNLNSVGDLYANADEGRQRLTMLNENTRLNNIQNLISAIRNNVSEQQKQFEFNEWMPWADKAQANAQQRVGADAQVSAGMQGIGSAAMQYQQQQHENELFDRYARNGGAGISSPRYIKQPQTTAAPINPVGSGQDFYQYPDNASPYNNFG